jgi:hypothetical protein
MTKRMIGHAQETTRAADDSKATTRFVVSTDAVARDGHIIDQSTWQLDAYRANPVVQWAHDYDSPPIGRAVEIGVVDGRLMATVEWDTALPLGATVARQFDAGFLSAVSVGWKSGRVTSRSELPPEHRYHGAEGLVFHDNELREFSAVPVPADPHALAVRGLPAPRLQDLSMEELAEWVRALTPSEPLQLTRLNPATLGVEAIVAALRNEQVREAILELVWSSQIPESSDWLRELDTEEREADEDFWRD